VTERLPLPRLHAVTDDRMARRPDLSTIAAGLARGAGQELALHARGPGLSGLEQHQLAVRLSAGPIVRLFVNDRLDIALALGERVTGVQLPAGGLPVAAARRLSPRWLIGRSVHSLEEAEAARAAGADYLVVGPVFATATHPDRPPLGIDLLRQITTVRTTPVIAIGGVTPARVRELKDAGVYGVAAIRSLWDAPDPAAAVRQMVEELQR